MRNFVHLQNDLTDDFVEIEFYFEEGFTGETITITSGEVACIRIEPTTRFQTGLAHVERVRCPIDEAVVIASEELVLEVSHRVQGSDKFIRVNRTEDRLRLKPTRQQPGYV